MASRTSLEDGPRDPPAASSPPAVRGEGHRGRAPAPRRCATMRATASMRADPGATSGTGHLEHRRAEVVGHDGGEHDRVGVARHPCRRAHDRGSTSASSSADRADSRTFPNSSRAGAVTGSVMSMRVMCLTPVHPSAHGLLDGRHEPVIELERAPGQPGAVERQIRAVPGVDRTRGRQVAQRLGAREDAVAEIERGARAPRGTTRTPRP